MPFFKANKNEVLWQDEPKMKEGNEIDSAGFETMRPDKTDDLLKKIRGRGNIKQLLNYGEDIKGKIEFGVGNWGRIYKGNLLCREVPFIWINNKETMHYWAIFDRGQFYGRRRSMFAFTYGKVVCPFSLANDMVDNYGRGYSAKFDETSKTQLHMYRKYTEQDYKDRVEDSNFTSQNIALYRDLTGLNKSKVNWTLLLIIVAAAIGVIIFIWYWHGHPGLLKGLTNISKW